MRASIESSILLIVVLSGAGLQAQAIGAEHSIEPDIARVRAATAPFRAVDKAISAGYIATAQCVQDPRHGAMGLHYKNPALRDGTVDLEHPEILLYIRTADGELHLTGVEYVVPVSSWTSDQPPALMGERFRREEQAGIWYLHVWLWEENPSGLFADFNPRLSC